MFDLQSLVRPNVKRLKPYSSARIERKGNQGILLDANENPFGDLNRYPDPFQSELKRKISSDRNIPVENIFIGNGSDEVIDLCFRIFCVPGKDMALTFSPTYGMYAVSAGINDVKLMEIPLDENFELPAQRIPEILAIPTLKLIFICSPNNPTGNTLEPAAIEKILANFSGIVVIDEAYIDFSQYDSWRNSVLQFPNLIVLQTLSKAWALAGARVGMAFAQQQIIELFNRIKPPYNVSQLNGNAAISAFNDRTYFEKNLLLIKREKEKLIEYLKELPTVIKVYPSDANFLLVQFQDANCTYRLLMEKGIVVRNRSEQVENCLRISVGNSDENRQLIKALKNEENTVLR